MLRPPVANDRLQLAPEGRVRIALKRQFSDGTYAIDLDPLALLFRLAATVPAPRFHTVRYGGVLASSASLRPSIIPPPAGGRRSIFRKWVELLRLTVRLRLRRYRAIHQ